MKSFDQNISLVNPQVHARLNAGQKTGLFLSLAGLLILLIAGLNVSMFKGAIWLILSMVLLSGGTIWYGWQTYRHQPEGIKNNGVWFRSLTNRGALAWLSALLITCFYVLLYFYPKYLGLGSDGAANSGLIAFFDPLSHLLKRQPASQWFIYGALYTLAILVLGAKFLWKYRHNRYQTLRTISVMCFQLAFAFLIPELLLRFNQPSMDLKNMWPLNYYFFFDWNIKGLISKGNPGLLMFVFGLLMIFVISPVLTWLYGKRWYCSWVCGCGGLAETAGDPFRHLSDKSLRAWQIERWLIHLVLVFAVVMTVAVLYSFFHKNPAGFFITMPFFLVLLALTLGGVAIVIWLRPAVFRMVDKRVKWAATGILLLIVAWAIWAYAGGQSRLFFVSSYKLSKWYGFYIGAIFSGVVGVGFYPIFGSRVWCRFGCPMAAILGLQQRFFSRFRITVNGGQCISCGNCSAYCEMGIDVRAYAQRGQDVVRASCVGCGICAAVCPRGVLRLENGALDIHTRTENLRVLQISPEGVNLKD